MLLISDHIVPIIADLPKRFEQGVDNIAEPPLRAPKAERHWRRVRRTRCTPETLLLLFHLA